MKFSIVTKDIQRIASTALKVIMPRTSLPAYQNFYIGSDDKGTFLIAASPDNQLRFPLPLSCKDKFTDFMVCAHDFVGIIASVSCEMLFFDVDMQRHLMEIDYQTGTFLLPVQDADTFPQPQFGTPDLAFTCDFKELGKSIAAASTFAVVDQLRPILSSVLLDVKADGLVVVATDGHSLYKRMFDFGAPFLSSGDPQPLAVPLTAVGILSSSFAGTESLSVTSSGSKMMFSADGIELIAAKLEGRYPNYDSVIPDKLDYSFTFVKGTLKSVLKRLRLVTDRLSTSYFAMNYVSGKVHLAGKDVDFSLYCDEEVAVENMTGDVPDGFALGINSIAFGKVLANIKSDNAVVNFSNPSRPIIVREDDPKSPLLMMTMPVLLDFPSNT